ncbi:MAG: epoxyqueuosine reductase QueH [Clostridiaceae bacterium]|jgi:predicted adenine nucleotide alpha hydrolase (AANH) superfamily ATPase|nr:epoxyqueuosine reductase QueH [Clostridiaceae bacterium]
MRNTKLLLHICCAPCATGVIKKLKSDGSIYISGIYYNPNIHPSQEHQERKVSVDLLSNDENIDVLYDDTLMVDYWKENLKGEKVNRCDFCYTLRIEQLAKTAKEMGYDAFTTTLLVSPWQNHEKIQIIGQEMQKKYDIDFMYQDFRPFYREGKNLAYHRGYYLQKYCGCIFSYEESDHKKKPIYTF